MNDIPAILARKEGAPVFADMIVDNFDEMLAQSEGQALVMGVALHPYIVGHRDEIWITHAREISRACHSELADLIT